MGRGGKRPGAGRPKGAKSRATIAHKATLEDLARTHTSVALQTLVEIATNGEGEAARVTAATALLDRGYGRPRQTHDTNITMGAGEAFIQMLRLVANGRPENGAVADRVADEPAERPEVCH